MSKSKIILADDDGMYLAPLEMKFLEETGKLKDTPDIEVITDRDYFDDYFSTPKSAEILVVSQSLYCAELSKQNISNIYVLCESMDEAVTADLNIVQISKYSSPSDIYNQVISTSKGLIHNEIKKTQDTMVVLFYSAAGGVGKTTLSMAMSLVLSNQFKKVLYINAQRLNSFEFNLVNKAPMPNNAYAIFNSNTPNLFNDIKYSIRNEGFDYLPPFNAALASLNIDFSVYESIIKSAKETKSYDVIVVDTDSLFDEKKASLMEIADKVLIVTNQTKSSVNATNMLLNNMNCSDKEKYYFVCNDFDENKYNAIVSDEYKAKFAVSEYIKHIDDIDNKDLSIISNDTEMQKTAYLVM